MKGINKMKTNLKNIRARDIENMMLVATDDNNPAVCVITADGEAIKHPLTDAFAVHNCNEFLHSLNIEDVNIAFYGYEQYGNLIATCAEMLKIQRIMKKQRSLGKVPATEVHSVILDILEDNGWNIGMIYLTDLPYYVKKATKIIKRYFRSKHYVPVG
jgi:hypothetical protein